MIHTILKELGVSNIKEFSTKFKFNCPYCKSKNSNGVIYKDSYGYHCFNCDVHKNLNSIISDFNLKIDINDINKEKLVHVNSDAIKYLSSYSIKISDFKLEYGLKDVYSNTRVLRFLKNNNLDNFKEKFLFDDTNKFLYVLNSNSSHMIGYGIIDLKSNLKLSYLNSLNDVLVKIGSYDFIEDSYNKLSYHYNILDLNLKKPINIFDNIIDSFQLENSIYAIHDSYAYDKKRYVYRNDKLGIKKAMDLFYSNKKVFDWKTFLLENGIIKKISNFKELNIFRRNNNLKFDIENFFIWKS